MERNNKSLQVYFRCKYCHQTFLTPESLINHKLANHAAEVLTIRPEAAVFAASAVEHPLCNALELLADAQRGKSEDNDDHDYRPSCTTSKVLEAANASGKQESGTERPQKNRTKETPFSCMYCFKSFSQCSALNSHMIQCESSWVDENVLEDHTGDDPKLKVTETKIPRRKGVSLPTTESITTVVRNQNVSKWILQNSLLNDTTNSEGTRVDSEHDRWTKQEESFFEAVGVESESRQLSSSQERWSETTKVRGWEHAKRYQCKYCDQSSIHHTYMLNHEKAHTLERPFKCSSCSKNYIRSTHLARHKPTCKGRTMQRISRRMAPKKTQPPENIHDRNEDANANDQKEEHSTRRDLSVKSPDYQSEIQNVSSVSVGENSAPVRCQLCNKRFPNRFLAANHQKSHSDGHHNQSSCVISGGSHGRRATFSNASSAVTELHADATLGLAISTKYKPTANGNHPANNSPKIMETQHYPSSMPKSLEPRRSQFKSENQAHIAKNLRGRKHAEDSWYPHIKRCYSKEGFLFYSCKFCGKTADRRADAVRHTVTHLGPDIHFCPRCPEKFPKRDLLVSHLAVHIE